MLGLDQDLKWHKDDGTTVIELPKELQTSSARPCLQAYVFKIESEPWERFGASLPSETAAARSKG